MLDDISLDLEEVAPILLLILGRLAGPRQLPALPDGHKRRTQPQRQRGPEEKAAGIKPNDDVRGPAALVHRQLEGAQQALVQRRVGKDGQDVLEEDAGLGEVGELAQRRL